MSSHSFEVTTVAKAPREKVWALVSDGAGWKDWAGVMQVLARTRGRPASRRCRSNQATRSPPVQQSRGGCRVGTSFTSRVRDPEWRASE